MEIKTLKDLKLALKSIPDKILEDFGAGIHEEDYVQLMVWRDESEAIEIYQKAEKKYPQIKDIDSWINNISKISKIAETTGDECMEEPISSKDKFEDTKSSPIQKLNSEEAVSIPPNPKGIGYP